ncbi:hypothetical protein A7P85_05650 [Eikenella corrodens]|uniref:DUF4124 domain-containing protein n=1 Tax=Eikenella corrodens TaxID=539 RepID=A0A1A9RE26_EIKCO|nr:hypothetical protein [Eikenella corrodens]OAM16489.1 hypothetical protein A7P85_05650 [Eikenella corrodens]OAM24202.1 hypothetical protein A7P92_04670 [Eikenella corrodens]
MNKKLTLLAACAATMLFSGSLMAEDVYQWNGRSPTYSDVPKNLIPASSNIVNVRTQTSRPAVAPAGHQQNQLPQVQNNNGEISAADLQAMTNQKQMEENQAREEANRKVIEDNNAARASNCNVAKINLQHAQTARIQNREQLIQQYQSNVNQFCN